MLRGLGVIVGLAAAGVGLMSYLGARDARAAIEPATSPAAQAAAQAPAFESSRAWDHLSKMVSIGPRPAGSPGIRQLRAYITRQMSAIGLTVQEQTWTAQTPRGNIEMSNLIVRLPGRRDEKILITGHYDTKPIDGVTFVGANDGGSSGAFLVELARVLKDRPREFTWELVWFDGEEAFCTDWYDCRTPDGQPDNTYGSRHYVKAAQEAGQVKAIRAMILVDMIAEKGARFLREGYSTPWLKDIIWSTAADLGQSRTFPAQDTGQIEDDHVPFQQAGIPVVDIIDLDYTSWHTPADTMDKLAAQSLQIVGDVLVASLPRIEAYLQR